jgi:hypothetical protein
MTDTNTDTHMPENLARLGDALDRAVQADLAGPAERPHRARGTGRLRGSRRVVAGVALTAVLVPAAAIAATQLISTGQVAASLPQGTLALAGTHPTCTVVQAGVEYHCVLAKAPSDATPAPVDPDPAANGVVPSAGGGVQILVKLPSGKRMLFKAATEQDLKRQVVAYTLKSDGVSSTRISTITSEYPAAPTTTPGTTTPGTTTPGATAPGTTTAPQTAATDWKGTVEDTVDATKHVNGGCRALNSAGTDWECYLGQEAVTQQIIGQSFLGQYAPGPGVG